MCSHVSLTTYTYILSQAFDIAAAFPNDSTRILQEQVSNFKYKFIYPKLPLKISFNKHNIIINK